MEPEPPDITYQCQRCSNCCRWPGDVRLTPADISSIARFLDLDEETFIQKYTRIDSRRNGLSLTEQADGACSFLDGNNCLINPAKPGQCRSFPNAWRFPGWRQVCEAVPVATSKL